MPRGKKQCPSCKEFTGVRSASCVCGYLFAKDTSKSPNKEKKINKRSVLYRLVEVPEKQKRFFFAREMKMLNSLCERYSLEFMEVIDFGKKFDSLAYLTSPKLRDKLDEKFRAFNYKFDKSKYPDYNIGEKCGEDIKTTKKKTIKNFLDE